MSAAVRIYAAYNIHSKECAVPPDAYFSYPRLTDECYSAGCTTSRSSRTCSRGHTLGSSLSCFARPEWALGSSARLLLPVSLDALQRNICLLICCSSRLQARPSCG